MDDNAVLTNVTKLMQTVVDATEGADDPSSVRSRGRALVSVMARYASREVFGNTVNRQRNVAAFVNWQRARWSYGRPHDADAHQSFRRLRCARLPAGAVDLSLVKSLHERFVKIVDDDAHAHNPFRTSPETFKAFNYGGLTEVPAIRRDIVDPLKSCPNVVEIFSRDLRETLENLLGAHFVVDEVEMWRNLHVPEDIRKRFEGQNDRWHFDNHQCDRLRLFVNLDDITIDDGPTEFFDHPTSAKLVRYGYQQARRSEGETGGIPPDVIAHHPGKRNCAGERGAAHALQTSFCLHRGRPRLPGHHRDLLAFTMQPALRTELFPQGAKTYS
jgi:hypothetical protein